MKKIKILFSAMALMIGSSVLAQNEVPVKKDGVEKKTELTMKEVSAKANSFTAEMCKELNITDKGVIQTISSINENYEVTLIKSAAKGEVSPEEAEAFINKLETNRLRRFQGILTPEQIKLYQVWKAKLDAKTEE